jgi:hypothetical protein
MDQGSPTRHPLRRAWISVALIPVILVLGFISSDVVIYPLAGYDPGATVTLWFDLAVWTFAIVVVAIPCAAAIFYGREAYRAGDRRGRVPLLIGSLTLLLVVAMAVQAIVTSEHL